MRVCYVCYVRKCLCAAGQRVEGDWMWAVSVGNVKGMQFVIFLVRILVYV